MATHSIRFVNFLVNFFLNLLQLQANDLVGKKYVERNSLKLLSRGAYSDFYDNSFDPRITNEFSTSAFRIGHSWVNQFLKTYKDNAR